MPCSSITLGVAWQSRKGKREGAVEGRWDVWFGVKAINHVLELWHTDPLSLPFMTLCISFTCFVTQFASSSMVHQVGIDSWGKGSLCSWVSVTLQWYIHLYREVRLICESPESYKWDLRRRRAPTDNKLEVGEVPVLWGLYMEIYMSNCSIRNSTGCSCPTPWALIEMYQDTCIPITEPEWGKQGGWDLVLTLGSAWAQRTTLLQGLLLF